MKKQRIFILVCIVLSALIGVIGSIVIGQTESKIRNMYAMMEEPESIPETEVKQEVTSKKPEEFLPLIEKKGAELAGIENQLVDVIYDGMDILEETAFRENVEQQKELFQQLKPYFVDGSGYTDVWYAGDKTAVDPKWEFCKNYLYSTSTVSCLWLCRDMNTNGILAYVTAIYDVNNDKFKSMELYTTYYGYQGYAVTLEDGEQIDREQEDMSEFANSILDMADSNKSVEIHDPLTDEQKEQMADMYVQRGKLREEYKKNGGGN